jgi:SAM-dependent methyltransferase
VSFDVGADAYGRFMGRFAEPLARETAALLDLRPGQQLLDVGCGPGALTAELASAVGASAVSAVDPSEPFVAAVRARLPAVDVRRASAEQLPFEDDTFDRSAAQLVVHFMGDPVAGLAEMARVTRPGGLVAACVWDFGSGSAPLSTFWSAVREVDPGVEDEAGRAGTREGHLGELFGRAGLRDVRLPVLTVRSRFATFEEWWEPYTLGVGPAGQYVGGLTDARRDELRERCRVLLPAAPFEITAAAWAAVGSV